MAAVQVRGARAFDRKVPPGQGSVAWNGQLARRSGRRRPGVQQLEVRLQSRAPGVSRHGGGTSPIYAVASVMILFALSRIPKCP